MEIPEQYSTHAEVVIARLKQDILVGDLAPATKLKIRELQLRYKIGATPIREALSQLAATGLIAQQGQRGFRIPPLGEHDLKDLCLTREIIECETFRLSMQNTSKRWEENVVSSFHLFALETERFYSKDSRSVQGYWQRHYAFHMALVDACPLAGLKGFLDEIYLRLTRYRRLTRTEGYSGKVVIREHKALMDAALSGNVDAAVETMRKHVKLNTTLLGDILRKNKNG